MSKRTQSYGSMASTTDVEFAGNISTEFNNLCDNIVTNIYTINQSWKTLESSFKSLGTSRDNEGLRGKIHVTQLSTNEIIAVTNNNIHKLNMIVRKGQKQQKLQVEKLTENFKDAIARYGDLQKQVADKMKTHLMAIASQQVESEVSHNTEYEQQALKVRELAFEQDMLQDKEIRIRQIEADVIDVNQIMRELSAMVNEQGEVMDRIENGIDYATGNVEEGTSEIIKAASYQRKFRRRLCYLVIIALIIAAITIGVLVTQLKR
ncbi:PREDICTED: syntaxin-12 [Nicrophorus vespilloides]|uniref:Syntaxin-12 n=1 Tax=Nicrophorus vespilloides TaxID=110193 RepID=A0ABM1NAV0_NICVS|nr:PREDICTED: syntaxin-12 [Nicrophorus vespilloides]XP_017783950.1 PREDICTED: syntaxin-12 [Nicrophorus vespilloides]